MRHAMFALFASLILPSFDTLYVNCGDKVYSRKLKVKGAHAWDAPSKPAKPRL